MRPPQTRDEWGKNQKHDLIRPPGTFPSQGKALERIATPVCGLVRNDRLIFRLLRFYNAAVPFSSPFLSEIHRFPEKFLDGWGIIHYNVWDYGIYF